VEKNHCRQI